jgi:hypothetical protein
MRLRTALAVGATLLVAAPAASATPRDTPVRDGAVEHRVRTTTFEASYTIPGNHPRSIRTEEWTSRDKYHSRITDAETGELVAETFQTGARLAIWDRTEGKWTGEGPRTRSGRPAMLGHSFAEEAAIQREVIAKGWYDKVGDGRYVSNDTVPSDGDNTTTLVLNADFTIVSRTTESRLPDGGFFRQTEETLVQETLEAAPAGAFKATQAKVAGKRKRAAKRARRA